MALLLGIDIGTTGLKTALLDGDGQVLAVAGREYPTCHPTAGWAEQDPEAWWEAVCATVHEVTAAAGAAGRPVAGISVSSMAPVVTPLDGEGRPLLPAMIWADKRAEEESNWLRAAVGEERINQVTANHIDAYYAAPKCLWLQRHRPDVYAQTRQIVMANGYVNFKLTGCTAIDHSHLPLLLLADSATLDWSPGLLAAMGLERSKFPPIRACLDILGDVIPSAAAELGIPAGTPVLAGTVDTAAALVGMGIVSTGQAFVSMGTGSNVGTCLDGPARGQSLVCVPHAVPGLWLALGVMTSTGASLKWFKNTFCEGEQQALQAGQDIYDELSRWAGRAPAGSGGIIYLPYLMGEQSPIWDANARGVFVGLGPETGRPELVRAIMEGCAFGIRQNLDLFARLGWDSGEVRIQGGAARSPIWNQIICDVVQRDVLVPPVSAGAPVGNAMLAGLATGVFANLADAVKMCVAPRGIYHPDAACVALYDRLYPVYQHLYPQVRDSFHALADFREVAAESGARLC